MPVKRGAGGKLQNYDSHGRYAKTNYSFLYEVKPSRKEKARRKEDARREALYHRAKNSKDPYLLEVFLAIEKEMPGEVVSVNAIKEDCNNHQKREFDIITKKCIIEVKGGTAKNKTKQYFAQKRFAEEHRKDYIIIAPNMAYGTKKFLQNEGFHIVANTTDLIQEMKKGTK